ncbi:PREDICTED: LOW QUALITY PROTEIN: uncharacterized protein LOC105367929 [Ceratosolen solmsi marchali]|uniref:LOW QUALITY PROTEIN: uncharacterized protein LOC105367929 n=1 Tax=Ceratosolen solmsi marchali TaxID=326594 RepID=A0AAJ6YVC9_9HYME|nr:PREDICTED: LOW QUALITY PROTEIN: uncharacterized protein LOC105367929 [Ceratosolen solmsi marchali]
MVIVVIVYPGASYLANITFNRTSHDDIDDFVPYQGEKFNDFDWKLLKSVAKSHHGNVLVSPISLKLSLILLYEGAQDTTAKELAAAMNLPALRFPTRDKFSKLLLSLQERNPEYELDIGTSIYMDKSILARQRYASIVKSFYNVDIINTNFSDTPLSAKMINNFVNNVTKGHISSLISNDAVLDDNLMFIVSALYFQGSWHRQPFSIENTIIGSFLMSALQTPFMQTNHRFYFAYIAELDSKILRLPYAGHKYAMYIILPRLPGQVDDVLQRITPSSVNSYAWIMQEVPVDILIPKFKFDFTSHLENTLRQLGIRDIFEDTATLIGILHSKSTSRRLVVTDIVQKAGIEVNERGTTAYTATEIEIGNKINGETFYANHPFLFYIEDEISGTILYMGVVNNPQEETGMVEATEPRGAPKSFAQMPPNFKEQAAESPVPGYMDAHADVARVGIGINDRQNYFNIELLQKLAQIQRGNVIVGTGSVKTALMILAEAAAGQTREQFESTLRLSSNPDEQRSIFGYTIDPYKDATNNIELKNAIKLWLATDVRLLKNYSDILHYFYKGEIQSVNFNNIGETIKIINEWAAQQTHGHINSIIDEGFFSTNTRIILTTAVYFKGVWLQAFDKTATSLRCFHVAAVGCKKVPLMENIAEYKYAYVPSIDAQVVQIPYKANEASMLILLPMHNGERALDDLTRNLAFTPISAILASLYDTELLLQIPRFSIINKVDLRESLEQLGIRDLFQKNANLTMAFPANTVKVNAVIHNARIDVNEEGTVASAITGVSVIPLMGSTTMTFRADKPFIFFLLDNQTNNILFAGRFTQPDD